MSDETKNIDTTEAGTSTTETNTEFNIEKTIEEPDGVDAITLKKELDAFKVEVRESNDKILDALEKVVNKEDSKPDLPDFLKPKEVKEDEEIIELTAKQKEIFEYYLDPSDGFKAWYDLNKNIFTIEVPMTLSNTTPAYRTMYKQDLRSKKVDQNDILGSIKNWCIAVAGNIKYEKRIKLK